MGKQDITNDHDTTRISGNYISLVAVGHAVCSEEEHLRDRQSMVTTQSV